MIVVIIKGKYCNDLIDLVKENLIQVKQRADCKEINDIPEVNLSSGNSG